MRLVLPRPWLVLALLLPVANAFAYAWLAATTVISRDQWRFLPMLQDWYAGQFQWTSLWLSHSQHRTPVYKLEFLLNALLFNLDMRLEVMLGVLLLAVATLLLVRHFARTVPGLPPAQRGLAAAALGWLVLSLNQWDSLVYGLGAVNGFGHLLFMALFWLWLDAALRQAPSPRDIAGLAALLAFLLLGWAAGHGPAFIASVAAVLIVVRIRAPGAWPASASRLCVALALTALAAELVYWLAGPLAPLRASSAAHVPQLLAAPGRVLEFLFMALSGSALPVAGMEHHGWPHILSLLLGAGIAAIYLLAITVFIRRRLWSASCVPAFLMAYSLLEIASVLTVRLGEGTAAAAAPRYVLDNALGLVGCFWALALWQAERGREQSGRWRLAVTALSAAALFTAFASSVMLWRHVGEQRRSVAAAVREVRTGDFEAQHWVCPDLALCQSGAAFMRARGLNVFRDPDREP